MERLHVFGLQEMELLRVFGLQLLREIYSFSPWFWSVMEKQPYTFDQWLHLYDIWKKTFFSDGIPLSFQFATEFCKYIDVIYI